MLLYSVYGGSRLYNLQTLTSDQDIRGVFIEPPNIFFSLDTMDYYEDIPSDTVMYSLRKFTGLLLKNNPNTLELLFAPIHKWITYTGYWSILARHKLDILSAKAVKAYKGYLLGAYDTLRAGKSNRVHLLEQFGYDTKEASHILRLLHNVAEIRTYGSFNPELCGTVREYIYAVKVGNVSFKEVMERIELGLQDIDVITAPGLLKEPNYDSINRLITDIQRSILLSE